MMTLMLVLPVLPSVVAVAVRRRSAPRRDVAPNTAVNVDSMARRCVPRSTMLPRQF
jgi:hypothetical protein